MGLNFNSEDKLCTGGKLIKLSGRPRESVDPPPLEALKTNVLRDADILDSFRWGRRDLRRHLKFNYPVILQNYWHHNIIHLFRNYAATTDIKSREKRGDEFFNKFLVIDLKESPCLGSWVPIKESSRGIQ